MSRDPQTPSGGSRQSEPPRNLDEALVALQAEWEKRERAEAQRDELRETVSDLAATYQVQYAAAYQEVERRLDEAVKALRAIAGQEKTPDSYRRPGAWKVARKTLASIEAQSERGAEHHDG